MKMIMAIVNGDDVKKVIHGLMIRGFQVTKFVSTGGFLRVKSTTILSGVSNERVQEALDIIKTTCSAKRYSSNNFRVATANINISTEIPSEIVCGGATVFVMDIEQFVKF